MSKPSKAPATSAPATSAVSIESIALNDTPAPAPAIITPEQALACLKDHFGVPSIQLLERGIKAALMASAASSRHGDIKSRLPIIAEVVKDGKATKRDGAVSVRDTEGVTRDASKMSADERKAFNELVTTVTAAKRLGILASK